MPIAVYCRPYRMPLLNLANREPHLFIVYGHCILWRVPSRCYSAFCMLTHVLAHSVGIKECLHLRITARFSSIDRNGKLQTGLKLAFQLTRGHIALLQQGRDDCLFVPLWETAHCKWLNDELYDNKRQQHPKLSRFMSGQNPYYATTILCHTAMKYTI